MRRLLLGLLIVLAAALLLGREVLERRASARGAGPAAAPPAEQVSRPGGPPPQGVRKAARVQVLDAITRRPIAGATVTAPSQSATTDERGFAELPGDLGTGATLLATAPGFVPGSCWLDGEDRDPWIPLRPGLPVAGRVIHANGEPAVRAELMVEIDPDVRMPLRPDSAGRFAIPGLPEGEEVRVRAGEEGYWPLEVEFTAQPGRTWLEIVLGEGRACEGVVVDEERRPVAGARVAVAVYHGATAAETFADEEGRFEIRGLPPYYGPIPQCCPPPWIHSKGYSARAVTSDLRMGESEKFDGDPEAPPHRCEVVVRPTAYVVLSLSYPDGSPVEDADVEFGRRGCGERRAPGEFWSVPLEPGPLEIAVSADGWKPRQMRIDVNPRVRNDAALRLEEGRRLLGAVVDGEGRPIEGAWVTFDDASTGTGADGSFVLRGLGEEPGTLEVEGYDHETESIEVRPGQPPLRVVLTALPRVLGSVVPPPPLRKLTVHFGHEEPNAMYGEVALVDREGRFEIFAPVGRRWLRIETEGVVPWVFADVDLRPGTALDLGVLRASEGLTIAGVVVDSAGTPIEDAEVGAHSEAGPLESYTASTDEAGRFSILRLPVTRLYFYARHEGFVTRWLTIDPARATEPLTVALEPGGVLDVANAKGPVTVEPLGAGETITLDPREHAMSLELPPGRYRVGDRVVEIREGETTRVDLGE